MDMMSKIRRAGAAGLAALIVASPLLAAAPSLALPPFPNMDRYVEGDILPDKVVFYTGKTVPPPEVSGSVSMDELRNSLKGKKVKEVKFNYGCSQALVEYKDGSMKLMSGLGGIDDEVVQEIVDARTTVRTVTSVPDFTKPIPVEATLDYVDYNYLEMEPAEAYVKAKW